MPFRDTINNDKQTVWDAFFAQYTFFSFWISDQLELIWIERMHFVGNVLVSNDSMFLWMCCASEMWWTIIRLWRQIPIQFLFYWRNKKFNSIISSLGDFAIVCQRLLLKDGMLSTHSFCLLFCLFHFFMSLSSIFACNCDVILEKVANRFY